MDRRRIGPYELLAPLGRGGMGIVYRARHAALGRDVAIKVIIGPHARDPLHLERFRLEALAAARLRHPNLVAIHDVGADGEAAYIVMELVEGESLGDRIERDGPMPARAAAALVEKLARALHYAHESLILHRDVKPANVLVGDDGEPRLADFGLAKQLDGGGASGPTRSGQALGTPGFMAPEQIRSDDPIGPRADVYGAGATLYALLTGEPPFVGGSPLEVIARMQRTDPAPPSVRRPAAGVDRDLDTICLRALEREPARRYPGAAELADDLRRWLRHEPIHARPPTLVERVAKWARRNPVAARVAAVATLVVTVAAVAATGVVVRAGSRADARARAEILAEARSSTTAALDELALLDAAGAGSDERIDVALGAFDAARRWSEVAPDDAAASRARFEAGIALGDLALVDGQWALARRAYREALASAVDDARARAALAAAEAGRSEVERRRAADVAEQIALARAGDLARDDRLTDAVFAIARYPTAETVATLTAELRAVTAALREAERGLYLEVAGEPGAPSPAEIDRAIAARAAVSSTGSALGEDAIEIMRRAHRAVMEAGLRRTGNSVLPLSARLVASRQERDVPAGELAVARLSAEAIGRIAGLEPRLDLSDAIAALGEYLDAESDELRAVAVGLALVRIGGGRVEPLLAMAQGRHGPTSVFQRRIERAGPGAGTGRRVSSGERSAAADIPSRGDAPGDARSLLGRAEVLERSGDPHGAVELLDRAIEVAPELVDAWNNRALIRDRLGDHAGALADLEQAIALDPWNGTSRANRGLLRKNLGDLRGALADLDEAVRVAPRDPHVLSSRGIVRRAAKMLEGALADLDTSLAIDPNRASSWVNRSNVKNDLGDPKGACDDLDRAATLEPREPSIYYNRANLRKRMGQLREAIADYTRAHELEPTSHTTLNNRGQARREAGDLEGALSDFERAAALAPDDLRPVTNVGETLLQLGQLDRAEAIGEALLSRDPDWLLGYLVRGEARLGLGKLPGARADLRRFVAGAPPADPRVAVVRRQLARIEGR